MPLRKRLLRPSRSQSLKRLRPNLRPPYGLLGSAREEVLRSMPEYQAAGRYVDSLKTEYAREAKRSADDFSLKYEEFLDQQRNLATSIRRKRHRPNFRS